MNFWKRYPADYQRKTARLTLAQHGAYTLLLDEFYTTEKPLPADVEELFRICRAMTAMERDAVRSVAEQFFPICEDGLRHNKRAVEEMEGAAPSISAARSNGLKGGRPRRPNGNPLGFSDETQLDFGQAESGNPMGSEAVTDWGAHSTTQSEPASKALSDTQRNTNTREKISATPRPAAPDNEGRFTAFWDLWPKSDRRIDRKKCLAKWRKSGYDASADEILAHVAAMKGTRKWLDGFEPTPLRYLNGEQWKDGVPQDRVVTHTKRVEPVDRFVGYET